MFALPTPEPGGLLTIGALAQLSGLTVRTLRYYEEMDLITPVKRSQGRYRLYHPRVVKRIKAILALQELNYSLEDILAIIGPSSEMALVDSRVDRVHLTRAALERQKLCIEQKLDHLNQVKNDLDKRLVVLMEQCHPCADRTPQTDCEEFCEHREVHLD